MYKALSATLAIQLLGSMALLAIPVLAPAAFNDIGISASYVGFYIALAYGSSMLSSLACGDVIHRFGAIRTSQLCLILCGLASLSAAGGTVWLLALSAIFMGFGYGPMTPASSHVLASKTKPDKMSIVFSIKQTGVPLGGALAGILIPVLVVNIGWNKALLVVAGACILTVLSVQFIRKDLDSDRELTWRIKAPSIIGPLRLVMSVPGVRRLAFMSFVYSSMQLCLVTYLVTYLNTVIEYSLLQAGFMLSVAQVAGVVARIAWGALADRTHKPIGVLSFLGISMGVGALITGVFTTSWPPFLIAIVCAWFGGTAISWNGVYLAEVARRAPDGRAVEATSGSLAFTYFGVLISPPLFGLIAEHGLSFGGAFMLLAIPAIACAVWLWVAEIHANQVA